MNNNTDHSFSINPMGEFFRVATIVHTWLATITMATGIAWNLVSTIVLSSASFKSIHFSPYKALSFLEFVCCINQVVTHSIMINRAPVFHSFAMASYISQWSNFILSGTIYSAIYLTLIMTVDRFLAVCTPLFYNAYTIGHRGMNMVIMFSMVTAFGLNSWASFYRHDICEFRGDNITIYYLSYPQISTANIVKNYYNIGIKVSAILALVIMTFAILMKLRSQRRVLRRFGQTRHSGVTYHSVEETSQLRQNEKSTIRFLVIVLIFGLIREMLNEGRRIVKLIIPFDGPTGNIDQSIWLDEQGYEYYTYQSLYIIGTQITALDRAVKFFFYMAISRQFRHEFCRIVTSCYSGMKKTFGS